LKVNIGKYSDDPNVSRKINIKIDDYDMWNLDHTLALIILPSLKKFKKNLAGCPANFVKDDKEVGFKKWENTIQKMIDAFEILASEDIIYEEKFQKTVTKGLKLFSKYFQNLWD